MGSAQFWTHTLNWITFTDGLRCGSFGNAGEFDFFFYDRTRSKRFFAICVRLFRTGAKSVRNSTVWFFWYSPLSLLFLVLRRFFSAKNQRQFIIWKVDLTNIIFSSRHECTKILQYSKFSGWVQLVHPGANFALGIHKRNLWYAREQLAHELKST